MARRWGLWWMGVRGIGLDRGRHTSRRRSAPLGDVAVHQSTARTGYRTHPLGVFEGKTTGTPIGLLVENQDQRSRDYDKIKDRFRPGHADYTYQQKYGFRDYRGGGRSSARETVMRVAAGAIARKYLQQRLNVGIQGYLAQMGSVVLEPSRRRVPTRIRFSVRIRAGSRNWKTSSGVCARPATRWCARDRHCQGCTAGVGRTVFERLDADLASAMMGINAVKGVEIGAGFRAVEQRGSEHRDELTPNGLQEQSRRRRARGHFVGPGYRGEYRAQSPPRASPYRARLSTCTAAHGNRGPPAVTIPVSASVRHPIAEAMMALGVDGSLFTVPRAVRGRGRDTPVNHRGVTRACANERSCAAAHRSGGGVQSHRRMHSSTSCTGEKSATPSSMRSTMSATSVDRVTDEEGAARTSLQVIPVSAFDFSGIDLAFFCGRAVLAERYAEAAAAHAWVIDSSAAFRGRESVPLIVADVNAAPWRVWAGTV